MPHHGSSPRVRGKRHRRRLQQMRLGLIPARAGKTASAWVLAAPSRAHPRACGENPASGLGVSISAGSSPRVRGKPRPMGRGRAPGGLIPARAGKTSARRSTSRATRAHPRACGENTDWAVTEISPPGSSPRVRGKQEDRERCLHHVRLIPARAGKTGVHSSWSGSVRAHPRACGENLPGWLDTLLGWGSSPRVRGKPRRPHRQGRRRRLIPARAGKTDIMGSADGDGPAHPRACGENTS